MSADHIFVAHSTELQQVQPPCHDDTWKKLEGWTVQQLRSWLGMRGVRSSDALKKDLVRIAYFTWKLALPVNPDEVTTQKQAADRLEHILHVDDQILPNPANVTNWVVDLKLLPTVTYPNIYNYLINTPGTTMEELKAYKSLDSYNYAINGWVQELFVHAATEEIVFVKAKVKPSQHTSAPYDAWVMLRDNGTVEAGRCCCTAGLGEVCSHVGALLFKIMGAGLKGFNQPDACTSQACEWNKAFCKQVIPELMEDINFELPRINKPRQRKRPARKWSVSSCSSDDDDELWDILAECAPRSMALSLLRPPHCTNFLPDIEDVISHVSVIDSDPIPSLPAAIATIIENSDDSDVFDVVRQSVTAEQSDLVFDSTIGQAEKSLWHEVRQHRITASIMGDVYSFMKSTRSTPSISLMNKIFGKSKSLDFVAAIKWGRDHEEEAAYEYAERLLKGTCDSLVMDKCGIKIPPGDAHIGASPDGYVTCNCHSERLLEIKCSHKAAMLNLTPREAAAQGKISYLQRNGKLKTTDNYYTQVQAQMALLNVPKCDFVVWTPKDFDIETIMFDQQYWDVVKDSVDRFYKEYVIPKLTNNSMSVTRLEAPPKKVQRRRPANSQC